MELLKKLRDSESRRSGREQWQLYDGIPVTRLAKKDNKLSKYYEGIKTDYGTIFQINLSRLFL